jgi:hypothetical protein
MKKLWPPAKGRGASSPLTCFRHYFHDFHDPARRRLTIILPGFDSVRKLRKMVSACPGAGRGEMQNTRNSIAKSA